MSIHQPLTRERILDALYSVVDQKSQRDVVSSEMIQGLTVRNGHVAFALEVPPDQPHAYEALRQQCEARLRRIPGVEHVSIVLTAELHAPANAPAKPASWSSQLPPHTQHVLAIASGKGGVGKSTLTLQLAMALAAQGLRVGVLDADIYGPSLPIMLGQTQHPQPAMAHGLLQPIEAHGLKAMSIGWLVGADSAVVWRGSMVTKALRQMLFGTAWGTAESPLDILLIDTPPGTGDIHLTLAQSTPLSGALIATTPQAVAATDAAKAIQMFRNLQVPVLGLVENMAGFEAPDGTIHQIFGEGQTDQLATTYHTPILARIPLHPALREAADNGTPLSAFSQTHPSLQEGFATLARHTARQLGLSPSKAHAA